MRPWTLHASQAVPNGLRTSYVRCKSARNKQRRLQVTENLVLLQQQSIHRSHSLSIVHTVYPSFTVHTADRPRTKSKLINRRTTDQTEERIYGPTMKSKDTVVTKLEEATPDTAVLFDEQKDADVSVSADNHEVMIAEATAAAIVAAAVGQVDVSAAENAAALDAATAATLIDAADVPMSVPDEITPPPLDDAHVKKNENRRKRYREKTFDEIEAEFPDNGDDISMTDLEKKKLIAGGTHEDLLAARRMKDRQRYATMTPDQRQAYNAKRREQYHRQSELSRQRRRERERQRYHALQADDAKTRNKRRAKLERERYQKLSPDELEAKNRRRRERAAMNRQRKDAEKVCQKNHLVIWCILYKCSFLRLHFYFVDSII